ncbi:MAG: hypothetical protein WC641_04010 [Patescibacteria group bacterium]
MTENQPSETGRTKYLPVIAIAAVIAIAGMFLSFKLGEYVGFRKTAFSYGFDRRHEFGREPRFFPFSGPMRKSPLVNPHGALGVIVSVQDGGIEVKSNDDSTKTVAINQDTVLRRLGQVVKVSDLKPGDRVLIIGEPDAQGDIQAKLIQVQ